MLDMGEPVRIIDLAENMIRLSGRSPAATSRSRSSAPAPGEKLHEELFDEGEHVTPTQHPKIDRISRPPVEGTWLSEELNVLQRLVDEGDTLELVGELNRIVRGPQRAEVEAPVSAPAETLAPG